jgi:KipI family sensor histidine kinase inhibitor
MGDTAWLIEPTDHAEAADHAAPTGRVLALHRALEADRLVGVVELVPAQDTLLVVFDPGVLGAAVVRAWLEQVERAGPGAAPSGTPAETVRIPVRYDGEDLDEVARLTRLTPVAVIEAHTGAAWTVAFTGFAPGFGYLVGGDPRLQVPRRDTPRPRVPAGAVALAGGYSGIYPRSSPGGWQLIGRTTTTTWDAEADPPALLRPGVRVQFEATS